MFLFLHILGKEYRHDEAPRKTIWNRTAVDDLRDAKEAINANKFIFEHHAELEEKSIVALETLQRGVDASDLDLVKESKTILFSSLKSLIHLTGEIRGLAERTRSTWLFSMTARDLRIREYEKGARVQAGMLKLYAVIHQHDCKLCLCLSAIATAGPGRLSELPDSLSSLTETELYRELSAFAQRVEEESDEDLPTTWRDVLNGTVKLDFSGLNEYFPWHPRIRDYADDYIGTYGNFVTERDRNRLDLKPFRTKVIAETGNNSTVRHVESS